MSRLLLWLLPASLSILLLMSEPAVLVWDGFGRKAMSQGWASRPRLVVVGKGNSEAEAHLSVFFVCFFFLPNLLCSHVGKSPGDVSPERGR